MLPFSKTLARSLMMIAAISAALTVNTSEVKAAISSREIANIVNSLHRLAHIQATRVQGETVKEMLEDYARKRGYEEEKIELRVRKAPVSDGRGIGVIPVQEAIAVLYAETDGYQDPMLPTKLSLHLQALKAAGATFGYDAWGSAVCGMNFSTVLVIDQEAQLIYSIILIYGSC